MVELEKELNGKEIVKVDASCDGIPEVRKRFPGVNKSGQKWRARIHHPKEKYEIHLGLYSSPEEAALVVRKKKAEYEKMFNGENSVNMGTCEDEYMGRKLPSGVLRRGYRRWSARITHPKLKREVSLGSYSTPEEAALAVSTKRAEFMRIYGWRGKVNGKLGSKDSDKVLEDSRHEVVSKSELYDEMTSDVKVPRGVRKLQSGKWAARITDPVTGSRIWLGTFGTVKEAVRSFHKGKAELVSRMKRAELDGFEGPMKLYLTSSTDNLISLSADKSNHEVGEVDVSDEQEHKPVHRLPISVIEEENSNSADVEYVEMSKGENSMNMETCDDLLLARKLPSGVRRRGYRKWGTRIHHPMLKREVSAGSYSTPEEAAFAVQKKRAEFLQMYGWREKVNLKRGYKDNDKVLEEPTREVVSMSELWVPTGARKLESGKWVARIDEAELAAKRKRAELDGVEGSMKLDLASSADNMINLSVKQECKFILSSPTTITEPDNSNSADDNNRSVVSQVDTHITASISDIDEAIRLGIINEYGELLGEYSELDRQMEFSLPDD